MYVGAGVSNVVSQVGHVQESVFLLLLCLMEEGDQVSGQSPVKLLVLGIQHQENQVKSRGRDGRNRRTNRGV